MFISTFNDLIYFAYTYYSDLDPDRNAVIDKISNMEIASRNRDFRVNSHVFEFFLGFQRFDKVCMSGYT